MSLDEPSRAFLNEVLLKLSQLQDLHEAVEQSRRRIHDLVNSVHQLGLQVGVLETEGEMVNGKTLQVRLTAIEQSVGLLGQSVGLLVRIVYGGVAAILLSVLGALLSLVIMRGH